jgi:hypothetical protein
MDAERRRIPYQRRQQPCLDQRGLAAAARPENQDKRPAGGDLGGQCTLEAGDRSVTAEKHRFMRCVERIETDIGRLPGPGLGRATIGTFGRKRHRCHGPIAALADILDIARGGGAVAQGLPQLRNGLMDLVFPDDEPIPALMQQVVRAQYLTGFEAESG